MATYAQTIVSQHPAIAAEQTRPLTGKTIAWCGALLIACYASVLGGLVRQWATDPDMGHGFLVPCVAVYIAWKRRPELAAVRPARNYWGLALVVWGAAQMILGNLA